MAVAHTQTHIVTHTHTHTQKHTHPLPTQFTNSSAVQDVIKALNTEIQPLSMIMGGTQRLKDLPRLFDMIMAMMGGPPSTVCPCPLPLTFPRSVCLFSTPHLSQ